MLKHNLPEQIITNAEIVLAEEVVRGSIKIVGSTIKDVSTTPSSLSSAIDFEGDVLIPGLVELHTDNLERHMMPRPNSDWPIKQAIQNHDREITAAGITTVFDAICVGHMDSGPRKETYLQLMASTIESSSQQSKLSADHHIHWRCEIAGENLMQKLEGLVENNLTGLFSVMDHTPGQRQFVSLESYYTYYQGKYGFSNEEMKKYMAERIEAQQKYSAPNRRGVVELAHEMNVPLASHDDATIEHVEEAIEDGIVVAEFPTTIEAAKASHSNGLSVLMGAPNVVRGKSHSGNISARELASQNMLDILSSDYVPFALLYGAILLEQHCEGVTLPDAIATISRNPASQVGLNDRGDISSGKLADLVRYRNQEDVPKIIEVWREGKRVA